MVEAVETIDGWYSLHDLRKIDWVSWKNTSQETRDKAIQEFQSLYDEWNQVEAEEKGSQVMYQVIGQDADLIFMFLRPTRSEERRVGKECRYRWKSCDEKKKINETRK